jgi:hypothetical protein
MFGDTVYIKHTPVLQQEGERTYTQLSSAIVTDFDQLWHKT